MASERQIEANRRNGSKGGPKTGEGKQRSRLNSIKHGLTSSTLVVLPEEDRQEYEELLRGFRESLQPEGGLEDALVLRLAQAHWRSLRSRCVETGMLHLSAKMQRHQARRMVEDCPEHLDLHEAIGVGFMAMPAERWQMYLRYDAAISRDFFRTLDSLTRQQRLRQPAGGAELSDSGIRSVSQNDAASGGFQPASSDLTAFQTKLLATSDHPVPSRDRQEAVFEVFGTLLHDCDSAIEAPESASALPQTLEEQTKAPHEEAKEQRESGHRRHRRTPRCASTRIAKPSAEPVPRSPGQDFYVAHPRRNFPAPGGFN